MLELSPSAFKPLAEDLDVFAHRPLLGVDQILVFAWQLRECRIGHERIEFVQAFGGFLRLSEETGSLFFGHMFVVVSGITPNGQQGVGGNRRESFKLKRSLGAVVPSLCVRQDNQIHDAHDANKV
jgi:hypothetical protein